MSHPRAVEVIESHGKPPALRVCLVSGPPVTFCLNDELTPTFHHAFGYNPERTVHLRSRLLQLLILLLLARSVPGSLRKIGYTPNPAGHLPVHEVGLLSEWSRAYGRAGGESERLRALRHDIVTSFPRNLEGPVRFGYGDPWQLWLDLDCGAIRYVAGAQASALAYIRPYPSDMRHGDGTTGSVTCPTGTLVYFEGLRAVEMSFHEESSDD